ncbi:MAG: BCCT family transporter [Bacillota bacterium]
MLKRYLGEIDSPVFWVSFIALIVALIFGAVVPEKLAELLNNAQSFIVTNFTWWYMLVIAGALLFIIWLAFSRFGSIKLGKDSDAPEYSNFNWIAMLFSCGIGVGFIFWGVAEPLYHFMDTPYLAESETAAAAPVAMQITLLHWGIHGWVSYAVIGAAIAYSTYRLGNPFQFSYTLEPLLGQRAHGFVGKLVDFLAVFATVAGISTSLGMGVISIRYGTTSVFGLEMTEIYVVIALIILIAAYTISAMTGLNRGIKKLSVLNVWLAIFVLAFVFIMGNTRFFLDLMVDGFGHYISNFVFMTFYTDPVEQTPWLGWWTVFYWGWWIAWGPFVGGFIGRISKGRTIREFIIGVMVVPLAMTVIWFSIIGGATIDAQMTGAVDMWGAVTEDTGSGIYALLSAYPMGSLIAVVVYFNMLTFLVTSADSAAFFVAMILSKGNLTPTTVMRVIWAILVGASAIVLTLSGGLGALQTVSILAALPFSLVIIALIAAFVKNLQNDANLKIDEFSVDDRTAG